MERRGPSALKAVQSNDEFGRIGKGCAEVIVEDVTERKHSRAVPPGAAPGFDRHLAGGVAHDLNNMLAPILMG